MIPLSSTVGATWLARKVTLVSRCRADSFYLAPGEYRSFEYWSMHVRTGAGWVEITHRSEIKRLEDSREWDGVCYVMRRHREDRDIAEVIAKDPDEVEMWLVDSRSINGKPDKGGRHHLSKIARRGVTRCGGAIEAVGKVLGSGPYAKDTVRWFSEESVPPPVQAAALRLLRSAQSVLSVSGMQSLVGRMRKNPCMVPMPEFDANTLLNLGFLERYPEERRIRLLESLWEDGISEAVARHASVCGAIKLRAGDSKKLADDSLRKMAEMFPEFTAKGLANGVIECGGENDPVITEMVAGLLSKSKRSVHLVALHPTVKDTDVIRGFIMDRSLMERDLLVVYEPLSEEASRVVVEALKNSRSLSMTHSVTRCENNIRLVMAAGCDSRLLEMAFAAWVRCPGALSDWRKLDTDRMFSDCEAVIDERCAELLYKRQLEVARVANKRGTNAWCSSENDYFSDELMAFLESSERAPAGVRKAAERHLKSVGRTMRDGRGRLCSWTHIVEKETIEPSMVSGILNDLCGKISPSEEVLPSIAKSRVLYRMLHNSRDLLHAESIIEEFERVAADLALEGVPELMSYARARVVSALEKHVETGRAVARAIFGETTEEEMRRHGSNGSLDFSNPVFMAAWEHSERVTPDIRKLIIEETGDVDLIHLSFLQDGVTDIVGGREGDRTTKTIQLKSMLHDRGAEVEWPERPKRWAELPGVDHLPWNLPAEHAFFREQRVILDDKEYDVRVIDNIDDLRVNAAPANMGNCTDTYADSIRRGDCLMLAIGRGGKTEINVSIERNLQKPEEWLITEAKFPRNKTLPAETERLLREQLGGMLNSR